MAGLVPAIQALRPRERRSRIAAQPREWPWRNWTALVFEDFGKRFMCLKQPSAMSNERHAAQDA